MTAPPIIRLSRSLYSDVPSLGSDDSEWAENYLQLSANAAPLLVSQTPKVRLRLPRTFAVADRAYRSSLRRDGAGEGRSGTVGPGDCSHHDSAPVTSTETQHQPVCIWTEDTRRCSPGTTAASPAMQGVSTSIPQQGSSCSFQALPKTAPEKALVVVESVLGFSAVRSLLELSHARAKAAATALGTRTAREVGEENQPPLEDSPRLYAEDSFNLGDSATEGSDACQASEGLGSSAGDVSHAVGRLVGWVRVAVACEALQRLGYPSSTARGEKRRVLETARKTIRAERGVAEKYLFDYLDVENYLHLAVAVATAEGRSHGGQYKVTERREEGTEWSTFDLEPTTAGPQGLLGGRAPRGGEGSFPATERVLEIRLICHPLVTMVPDIRWCLRLICQAKAFAALLNANAKLSTLGGGYFLTRQTGQAIRLALAQSEVAMEMGDSHLAGKCHVNLAYNYIWLGQYDKAEKIIHAQVATSRATNDMELECIASIAGQFLRRSKEANRRLLLESQADNNATDDNGAAAGGGRDGKGGINLLAGEGWVQQRIDVKTDEWHRVRALPMYCSSDQATSM